MSRDALIQASEENATTALRNVTEDDYPVVSILNGLRLAILASVEADERVEEATPPAWARVELFGHTVRYGLVREKSMYGRRFVELFQPNLYSKDSYEPGEEPELLEESAQRFYNPNAIYAIEPIGEKAVDEARRQEATRFMF